MKNKQYIFIILAVVILIFNSMLIPLTHVTAEDDENKTDASDSNLSEETTDDNDNSTTTTDNDDDTAISDIEEDENESQSKPDDDVQRNEDDDNINEEQEEYEKRDLKIQSSTTEVEITSEWKRDALEDEFTLRFTLDDESPQLIIEYTTEKNASETELEYIVILDKIKEYVDTNHNGRYNRNDTILSNYNFANVTFKNIIHTVKKTSENETVHVISTGTTDGVFSIVLHVGGNFTKIESGTLSPSEVKIDFIINYPYTANNSMIALKTKLNTQYETETDFQSFGNTDDDENDIKIISKDHTGFFSWAKTVLVDNISRPVNITIIQVEGSQSENKDTIYFCYLRGAHIVHDPKVGVISLSSLTFVPSRPNLITPNNILLYLTIFLIVALIFIGAIYLRKRM